MSFAHGGIETTAAPRDLTNPARAARPAASRVAGLSRPGASGRLRAMSDLHDEFLGRWDDVDPLDGPPSPARDLVLAAQFEDELQNGGLAQFLWNFFPRWEEVLDGVERAYRAMGAEKQVAALADVRALLRENAPACAPLVERAKGEKEPGRAFGEWYAGAEERMSLPSEDLFLPDDPGLAAKRLAYVEAHRDELFGASPPARLRPSATRPARRPLLFQLLVLAVFFLLALALGLYRRAVVDRRRAFEEWQTVSVLCHLGQHREAWERLHPDLQARRPFAEFAAGFTNDWFQPGAFGAFRDERLDPSIPSRFLRSDGGRQLQFFVWKRRLWKPRWLPEWDDDETDGCMIPEITMKKDGDDWKVADWCTHCR